MFASFNARAIGRSLSAARTIELAASAGFGGVDLLVRDVVAAGDDLRVLRSQMDDLGLRGGAWPLPVDWRGKIGKFHADLAELPRLADAAATLGLFRTGTWAMPGLTLPADGTGLDEHRRAVIDLHVERLGEIARVLDAAGTRLGLEVIGVESSRAGSAEPLYVRLSGEPLDSLLDVLRRETPSVGLLVDAFHLYAANEPVEVGWSRGADSVVWVHLADVGKASPIDRKQLRDAERGLPGEVGVVDCRTLLAGLAERGYDGPVTAEPFAACQSLKTLQDAAAAKLTRDSLKRIWPTI